MGFQRGEVRRGGTGISGVLDEVTAHCKSCSFFFFFVRFELTNEFFIGDGAAGGNLGFFNEPDGVSALDAGAHTLCEAAEFVGGGVAPVYFVVGVGDELAVLECAAAGFVVHAMGEVV